MCFVLCDGDSLRPKKKWKGTMLVMEIVTAFVVKGEIYRQLFPLARQPRMCNLAGKVYTQ